MGEPIKFYRKNEEPYGVFSNLYRIDMEIDGKVWPSSEHYFQAQKFAGTPVEEELRLTKDIYAMIRRARTEPLPAGMWPEDWDARRIEVMRTALHAKFTQNEELREILMGTGDAEIIEHTSNDSFWADGGDGSGENVLGLLLMELRSELRGDKQARIPNSADNSRSHLLAKLLLIAIPVVVACFPMLYQSLSVLWVGFLPVVVIYSIYTIRIYPLLSIILIIEYFALVSPVIAIFFMYWNARIPG